MSSLVTSVAAAGLFVQRRCAAPGALLCRQIQSAHHAPRCAPVVAPPSVPPKKLVALPLFQKQEDTRSRPAPKEEFNVAFMYLKPHANTQRTRDFMRLELPRRGLEVMREGTITAEAIKKRRIIDVHYGSLATKALAMNPSELLVQPEAKLAFETCFGLSWESALAQDLVCNASEAMERGSWTPEEICALWDPLEIGIGKVKFGGGFYCGKIGNLYVINGFYLNMQRKYIQAGNSVRYFVVRWKPSALSWKEFRRDLLGDTNPSAAKPQSLRGKIRAEWKQLGLPAEPHVGDNAVHASASPFEALAERMNWLASPPAQDYFGKKLLRAGIPSKTVEHWCSDPDVDHAGKRQSLFDIFEDTETGECVEVARQIHAVS